MQPEVIQKATSTATYGGSLTAVLGGLSAHEIAAYAGIAIAIAGLVANIWINWHWKRKTFLAQVNFFGCPDVADCPNRQHDQRHERKRVLVDRRKQEGAIRPVLVASVSALTVSAAGLGFLAGHEGLRLEAYPDPGHGWRVPTICYGATAGVERGQVATFDDCNRMLHRDASYAGRAIARCTHVALTQAQYDALVSFTYNVGGGAYCNSTLARRLNAGDCNGAAAQFERWVFSAGQRLPGLERRRAEERAMFEADCAVMLAAQASREE